MIIIIQEVNIRPLQETRFILVSENRNRTLYCGP